MVNGSGSEISPVGETSNQIEARSEIKELADARASIDRATAEPLAAIQTQENLQIQASEEIQKELEEALIETEPLAEVKIEGIGEGQVTVEGPSGGMDPDPVDLGGGPAEEVQPMGTDSRLMEEEEEPIQGMVGDSHLMEEEPVQGRTAAEVMEEEEPVQGRVAAEVIEEEEPVQGRVAAEAMEKEEPIQGLVDTQLVSQLMEQLPEGAAAFTDQTADRIAEQALAGGGEDFLVSTQASILEQFENLTPAQTDRILAASLLKAAENLSGNDVDEISDMSQMNMLKLQDAMNMQSRQLHMMSNIQKIIHDTAMAIIRNMK